MNRTDKENFVKDFSQKMEQAQAIALMSFSKISVEQVTAFRKDLALKKIHLKVIKNTLANRVFGSTPYIDGLKDHFVGPTMVAYGSEDPVVTAKAIWEWAKKEDFNVSVKAGVALGQVMSDKEIEQLSKLPGKDELFVSFLWALKHHPTRFLYALQDAPKRLGYALCALKEKKENDSGS